MFENFLQSLVEQKIGESAPEALSSCYVFTIKKSGTHLLRNVLEEIGMTCIDRLDYTAPSVLEPSAQSQDSFVLSHQFPSRPWRAGCQSSIAKIIMNLRDPRAVFLSLLDFYDWERPLSAEGMHTVEFRREACRAAFKNREALGVALLEDELLDDDPFTPWLNFRRARTLFHHPGVLKVRYEDFFRTEEEPEHGEENVVLQICHYLGRPIPKASVELMNQALGTPSITKNIGQPDRWRTGLSPRLLCAFMKRHGDLVREFGYPEN